MGVDVSIKVGDEWLEDLVDGVGGEKITHRADGGSYALSWDQTLPENAPLPALLSAGRRVPVQVLAGGSAVWGGHLDSAMWSSGEMTAAGTCRQAESAIAADIGGGPTLNPTTALVTAAARGAFPVRTLETFGPLSTDVPVDGNYVNALFDAWALRAGRRWSVTPGGVLISQVDPVVPTLFVEPGVAELAVSTQAVCTAVWLCYTERPSMATKRVYVQASDAGIERIADATMQPSMTAAEAVNLAHRILAKTASVRSLAGSVTVPAGALTNGNGVEVSFALVRGQEMVQLVGAFDGRNGKSSTDFVIGESVWDVRAKEITLTPVEAVPMSFEAVLEDLGMEAR